MSELKLIVAGGRDYADLELLEQTIIQFAEDVGDQVFVSIVSGMARGADKLAADFARRVGVQLYEFPADWDTYGKSAGYRRNTDMAQFADALIAFHDGASRGTKHMIETMKQMGKPVTVISY